MDESPSQHGFGREVTDVHFKGENQQKRKEGYLMTKRILCLMASLIFLACLVPLSYGGSLVFQIGDKDGFGFVPEELVGAVELP